MNAFLTRYQSANLSDEHVIDNFVVRTKEFDRIMADIRTTPKGTSFQHYIYVGRRGSGKSTLLRRIQAEIHIDEALASRFLVTNLSEEQAGIYRLHDLWDYVLRDLRSQDIEVPEPNREDYQHDLRAYSKYLYHEIHVLLEKEGKQLVLLLDNIDRIFKNIGKDASLLREQLMNFNDVRIIGGSTIMAEDFWQYDMPFYQFFSIKQLEALSTEEINELLYRKTEHRANAIGGDFHPISKSTIYLIEHFTDCTPLTIQKLSTILSQQRRVNDEDLLLQLIELQSPEFRERLASVSAQQRKILVELASHWRAATVEELVPNCAMRSKDISAQLSKLTSDGEVEKLAGQTSKLLYRIADRPYAIWLEATQCQKGHNSSIHAAIQQVRNWHGVLFPASSDSLPSHRRPTQKKKKEDQTADRGPVLMAAEAGAYYVSNRVIRILDPDEPINQELAKVLENYNANLDPIGACKKLVRIIGEGTTPFSFQLLSNLFHLWEGKMEEFEKGIEPLYADFARHHPSYFEQYIFELLVHKQYNTATELVERATRARLLLDNLPIHYALKKLKNQDQGFDPRMPRELEKPILHYLGRLRDRQSIYHE